MTTRWLVDGMNVIGSRPDGWWRDRKRAVVNLVDDLEAWAAPEGDPVTVVFDGDPPAELVERDPSGVEMVFAGRGRTADDVIAGRGRTADDVIAARVAADPDPGTLIVVTSDGELIRRVGAHGARVLGAGAFRRRLDGAARARE
jgi:predicted RNA-binding protein with PIN domain